MLLVIDLFASTADADRVTKFDSLFSKGVYALNPTEFEQLHLTHQLEQEARLNSFFKSRRRQLKDSSTDESRLSKGKEHEEELKRIKEQVGDKLGSLREDSHSKLFDTIKAMGPKNVIGNRDAFFAAIASEEEETAGNYYSETKTKKREATFLLRSLVRAYTEKYHKAGSTECRIILAQCEKAREPIQAQQMSSQDPWDESDRDIRSAFSVLRNYIRTEVIATRVKTLAAAVFYLLAVVHFIPAARGQGAVRTGSTVAPWPYELACWLGLVSLPMAVVLIIFLKERWRIKILFKELLDSVNKYMMNKRKQREIQWTREKNEMKNRLLDEIKRLVVRQILELEGEQAALTAKGNLLNAVADICAPSLVKSPQTRSSDKSLFEGYYDNDADAAVFTLNADTSISDIKSRIVGTSGQNSFMITLQPFPPVSIQRGQKAAKK